MYGGSMTKTASLRRLRRLIAMLRGKPTEVAEACSCGFPPKHFASCAPAYNRCITTWDHSHIGALRTPCPGYADCVCEETR